jgi:hypothetical protein
MPVTRHNILPVAFEVKRNGIGTQTNEWARDHPRMIFRAKNFAGGIQRLSQRILHC